MSTPNLNLNPEDSGCCLDHRPDGSSRQKYEELRKLLYQVHGDGYDSPVDVSELDDDVIEGVAFYCAMLRNANHK